MSHHISGRSEGQVLYELRKYEVMPGKMQTLVKRFETFTVGKWQEYGFHLMGFWTPEFGGPSNQLVYIWGWESVEERMQKMPAWRNSPERQKKWEETEANGPLVRRVRNSLLQPTDFSPIDRGVRYDAQEPNHAPYVFELREYDAMPGKISALVNRFGNFTSGAFAKHGFRQVGYWTSMFGDHDQRLTYILAWKDHEERNHCFHEFHSDPERAHFFEESNKNGQLVERNFNIMLTPTSFSPMQ
jgi:hypothetical protein